MNELVEEDTEAQEPKAGAPAPPDTQWERLLALIAAGPKLWQTTSREALLALLQEAHASDPEAYRERWLPYLRDVLSVPRWGIFTRVQSSAESPLWRPARAARAWLPREVLRGRDLLLPEFPLHLSAGLSPEDALFWRRHPTMSRVRTLHASRATVPIALAPALTALEGFSFNPGREAMGRDAMERILYEQETFQGLRGLALYPNTSYPGAWVDLVAGAPQVFGLELLRLSARLPIPHERATPLDDLHLYRLLRRMSSERLWCLYLDGMRMGDHGARVLAESETLRNVTHLSLMHNDLTLEGLRALLESPNLQQLQHIRLRGNMLDTRADHLLDEHEGWPELVSLDISTRYHDRASLVTRMLDDLEATGAVIPHAPEEEVATATFTLRTSPREEITARTALAERRHAARARRARFFPNLL